MPALVFPALVRNQILEQHRELRALLERILRVQRSEARAPAARAGMEADPDDDDDDDANGDSEPDARRLADVARDLCQRFAAHLSFEQAALTPIFAIVDAWGPERVKDLHEEHQRQNRELATLATRFELEDDAELLGAALYRIADDLLRDMDEEEAGCLRASLLSADSLFTEPREPE